MFKVTYQNLIDGKRYTLIDKIDRATADAVVAKFGNESDKFNYLPGLQIEADD